MMAVVEAVHHREVSFWTNFSFIHSFIQGDCVSSTAPDAGLHSNAMSVPLEHNF